MDGKIETTYPNGSFQILFNQTGSGGLQVVRSAGILKVPVQSI